LQSRKAAKRREAAKRHEDSLTLLTETFWGKKLERRQMLSLIEPLPPIYRVILLILVLYILLFFQIYAFYPYLNHQGRQLNGRYLLPDIFHFGVPNKLIGQIHDLTTTVITTGFVVYFAFVHYPTVLYYLVVLLALKLLLRVFHMATVLPDSKNGDCHYATHLFEMMRHRGSCNNLNISGHLVSAGLALYLISVYQGHRYAWVWIGLYIVLFFTTTVSRNHYTIDCLTATLLLLLVISQTERIQGWIKAITGMHLSLKKTEDKN
jgi:hypothetical protein